jgi:hypothetical protein
MLTPELKVHLDSMKIAYDDYDRIRDIISNKQYSDLYNEVIYSSSWDIIDYMRIIHYINKHDADVFTTLNILAGDYYHAMYVHPSRPGLASTSIMILGDLKYGYPMEQEHTPAVDAMVEEMYAAEVDIYKKDFNESYDILVNLFQRTMQRLTWGAKIF